ncbi:MAG: ribbon-helix-helix protein, CopG family [Candidatus Pseudoruminococcus sp.]|uniref:ribbon-helix-helix protein, CopG family n=1 Tax=Candidatus Pseudoruminococcus sp. TaxID=3101048 RepID=UPI002A786C30|nr:ribbon-helix-helix domain-containing protein [Ruminococcus sp.]MDY2782597.1 ribbon-helix-helix protein, CopG family [Candidatus Pseudoruminococcus sp.]
MAESKLTIKKRNPLKGEDGSKVISVRIKDEIIHRLDELAKETNRSRNEIIGILLEFGLDNVEVE